MLIGLKRIDSLDDGLYFASITKSELEKITVKKYNSNKIECEVTNDKEKNSKLL